MRSIRTVVFLAVQMVLFAALSTKSALEDVCRNQLELKDWAANTATVYNDVRKLNTFENAADVITFTFHVPNYQFIVRLNLSYSEIN